MTATLNGMYNSAPDTPSPVYPDRLIRPLPKRTLRSRLSTEAADSILYPLAPPATQLFYGTSLDHAEVVNDTKVYVQQSLDADALAQPCERDAHLPYENGIDLESGDENGPVVVRRSAGFRGSSLSSSASSVQPHASANKVEESQIKSSSAGPDGYDAFENTNNKKKRKIPTPGSLGGHHSTLSPEFSNMGLANSAQASSNAPSELGNVGTYYGTGSPASPILNGISGPGRGRLGRHPSRSGASRNPVSIHSQVGWPTGRAAGRREGMLSTSAPAGTSHPFPSILHGRPPLTRCSGDPTAKPDQGIISAAIANAATFSSPLRGPSNTSLLEQQQTPTKTQFTFTCESDSSKGMAMQAQHLYPPQHRSSVPLTAAAQIQRGFATQGTQTSPSMNAQVDQQGHLQQQQQQQPPLPQQGAPGADSTGAGRKKKRSPGSIYALAARQRKIQQQYTNLHHPPSLDDIWICEFCEYESIFGRPPEALIRQYEIKDRKERKRLAEKKRLLEKAKMKGRKSKKATKNAAKNAAAHQAVYDPGYDRASVDHSSAGGHGGHDDDYLPHEYDDEPIPMPPPAPPNAFKTPPASWHPVPAVSPPPDTKPVLDGANIRPP
ncbi:uncharacterized protein ACLA_011690 [Aspergillus clavatus NRRL 1]|uniref:Uncharacterized protein n=1 Tax=Aspergillus clavatus (strain ATCC 1007 / CBS 513.65 / DSM 816 / NCTC 3887 / NRRL 1 / QM 1276 / 107) TaxID=344612 RepID=A1CAH4_ASPCL|nr:uncharacterized protein ACLA_011690 [Aspergillus clavatus NRRL 1]EAW12742.1 conserved hypothetical protein [Aspergillus clavatus NRRL 1]